MKKYLLALLLLALPAYADVWWSEGLKVNAVQDAVLADTGAVASVRSYRLEFLCSCQNNAVSTTTCAVEIQHTDNSAVVLNDPISGKPRSVYVFLAAIGAVSTEKHRVEDSAFDLAVNDHLRIIFKGSATLAGSVKCTLFTNQ